MRTDLEKEAGALVLKDYGNFFKLHHQELLAINNDETWVHNKSFMPVEVVMAPNEEHSIAELLSSDNVMVTKVLTVLSSLCIEIVTLKKEAFRRHFKFLSLYEEYNNSDIEFQMDALCALSNFVNRCGDTLNNICHQVFSLYSENVINLSGIQLHYIISHIGELFTIIVLIELLISNTSLSSKWQQYCKSVKAFQNSPQTLELNGDKLQALIGALDNMSTIIMNDDIVQNTLQNLAKVRKSLVDKNCSIIGTEFAHYLKHAIINLDKLVMEKPNVMNMFKCIKINSLFVLNSSLFGSNDKKIFKSLTELNTKAHSIHIMGTCMWFPEQFLQRHAPSMCTSYGKLSQTILKARHSYMTSKKASFLRDLVNLQATCTQWVIASEKMFSASHHQLNAAEMSSQARILLEGIEIASGVSCSVLSLINLHLALGVPLPKSVLMSLFGITEILKSMQNVVLRNYNQIISSLNMIVQHLIFQAVASISEVKKTLMNDKNYSKRLDELTCIFIAERSLKGAATLERNIAANIALSFVPDSTYTEGTYERLGNLLEKMQILSSFIESIQSFSNCSWMIWHQHVIPIFFEQDFSNELHSLKLKYFMMVLEDCALLIHETDKVFQENKYQQFIERSKLLVENRVLNTASQNIEVNLRLHIHSHLQLDLVNPFNTNMNKRLLLVMNTMRLQHLYMSVIPSLEHYLSTMFYNLTTVVLTDWKTYGEMRQMAKFKFNLKTIQDNLPTQTLEQGLDVLEIMRNIHTFVSKYLYNLNNQIFIEKSSNNKHLNSINIRHIANSIRTHGTGIMNTTVNFTYQFLKKKFFTFSQFMFDEQIKSRLVKDLRTFKESADKMFSYKAAEKFNKGIRSLGLADEGLSYLDLFRELVSHIGNAMGYVRMIRSGGRHCCSDATVFLSSLEVSTQSFRSLCENNGISMKSIQSAENLDDNINGLINNFNQGTEYFKLLVDVFAPVFRNPKNVHLKNFYIIVPPLTLNFVEHMILSKDKMSKKNKIGAAFTDDGFAMGVAYILKLLDQDSDFESLHWFDSVWNHIKEERNILEEQKFRGSSHLQQALALTEKKIKTLEEEYKLLYYSLSSARIFFR